MIYELFFIKLFLKVNTSLKSFVKWIRLICIASATLNKNLYAFIFLFMKILNFNFWMVNLINKFF